MELVQRHRVTRLLAVPAIFNALVHHHERPRFDLSSLRQVIIGGSPASPALVRALEEQLGVQAFVGYGLTETAPILTLAQPRRCCRTRSRPRSDRNARPSPAGRSRASSSASIDSEGHDVRPDGERIGEIIVRGNTVMDGYYRDPDATSVAIRDGWLRTGDMATLDEAGYVLIKDRSKDVIIRGGENISSVEVENALAAHPAVLECAVVAAPDGTFGEAPVALVVLKPGHEVSAKELKLFCRARLARFKVPREIHFRDALPKGGTGKILKTELREPFWTGLEARVH